MYVTKDLYHNVIQTHTLDVSFRPVFSKKVLRNGILTHSVIVSLPVNKIVAILELYELQLSFSPNKFYFTLSIRILIETRLFMSDKTYANGLSDITSPRLYLL